MESQQVLHSVPRTDEKPKVGELLLRVPVFIAVAFGLIFLASRVVLELGKNLKESPDWRGFLLLTVLIGSMSIIIVLLCAGIGVVVGFILRACFVKGRRMIL